jgi:hypothetical protein
MERVGINLRLTLRAQDTAQPESPMRLFMAALFCWRTLGEVEREHILLTLRKCMGNRTRAAKALDISLRGLRLKVRSYKASGFNVPGPRNPGEPFASLGPYPEAGQGSARDALSRVAGGMAVVTAPFADGPEMDRLERKQRGRPRSGQNPILNQVRLSPELIDLLSRRALVEGTTRSELIRRLVEAGLYETYRTHAGLRQLSHCAWGDIPIKHL